MTIFDTVTLFSHGNQKIHARIDSMDEDEELAVTLITRMEILRGRFDSILKAADATQLNTAIERFQASEDMLDDFQLVRVDGDAAQHFERLLKQKKTAKMKRPDLLIACVALAQRALLVTRNVKDYKDVAGLRIENWAD
jgi:tRNA(fMet)-specific endonuclease VapC